MQNKVFNQDRNIIERWDEAIPLGNGAMGGLLFGENNLVKLSVDCSSLWDLRQEERKERADFTFAEFLRLVQEGADKNEELQTRFGRFYEACPFPTKIPSGAFQLVVPEGEETLFRFIKEDALGVVQLSSGEKIECFFSANNLLGYIRCPKSVEFSFIPPDYQAEIENNEGVVVGSLGLLGYQQGELTQTDGMIIYRQPMKESSYSVLIKYQEVDEKNEIVFTVKSQDDIRLDNDILQSLENALLEGFDCEFLKHKKWWNTYFEQTSVCLPNADRDIQELYETAHYLMGAGSRKGYAPMALQGVWTAAEGFLPPWKGDYHFDLNVQGTYNWAYRAGRFDEIAPLVEYFIKNKENIERFSKNFFGLEEAFFIPGAADLNGNVMGGWVQYTYSIGSSIWMVLVLEQWYSFTKDEDYKKSFLLPILKKTYLVLKERFLVNVNGTYEIVLSVSPEINNADYSSWVKNSTYDISIIKAFLKTYARYLQANGEDETEVMQILQNMPREPMGEEGYWLAQNMPLTESHRHLSHCMNIFPFQTLDFFNEGDKRLMKNTLQNLEKYGTSMWVGFSFVWMSVLYACAVDGENAVKYLKIFSNGFTSANGFHLNGDYNQKGYSTFDYRPFTLEANGMLAEAVQEMLMQYHHGILRLFPATPKTWEEQGCSFKGFYLDKDVQVSASLTSGKIECNIENNGEAKELKVFVFGEIKTVYLQSGRNELVFANNKRGDKNGLV